MGPLYEAVVARGRDPRWYTAAAVPDTQDGRFDMIATILALVLIRLERDGEATASESALLVERFIADMDGQLRQIGIGDIVVGKHVGKMMGALGGRLTAYRDAFARDGDRRGALARNLYRGEPPGEDAAGFAEARLSAFFAALAETPTADVLAGRLPE